MASSTDPNTWSDYTTALAAVKRYGLAGVGFVFTSDDRYAGIDLDDCRTPETGEIAEWAQGIIAAIDSYTEVSPSKTGVKIFLRGKLPEGAKHNTPYQTGSVEMYSQGRFFTFTGLHLAGTPETVEDRQAELTAVYADVFGTKASGKIFRFVDPLAEIVDAPLQPAQDSPKVTPKGQRTKRMVSLAGTLHRRGVSLEAIEACLAVENQAKADPANPPLPPEKVRAIARDIPTRYKSGGPDVLEVAVELLAEGNHQSLRDKFAHLCMILQRLLGDGMIILPCERIGESLGCDYSLVARFRRKAVAEGWLRQERPSIMQKQAAKFRVIANPFSGTDGKDAALVGQPEGVFSRTAIPKQVSYYNEDVSSSTHLVGQPEGVFSRTAIPKQVSYYNEDVSSSTHLVGQPVFSRTPPSESLSEKNAISLSENSGISLSENAPAENVEIQTIPAPKINNSEIPIYAADPDLLSGSEKSTEIDGVDCGAEGETEATLWF
jgi:hypothetical protein